MGIEYYYQLHVRQMISTQEILSGLTFPEQLELLNIKRLVESDDVSKDDVISMLLTVNKALLMSKRLTLNLIMQQETMDYDTTANILLSGLSQMG
jgi:hypothetical protein